MNWEAIGALGEVGGFAAVLATLLYLSAQMRQVIKQNKFTAVDSGTRAAQLMQIQAATHPELAQLIVTAIENPSELTRTQLAQLRAYVGYFVLTFQQMFKQFELGYETQEEWDTAKHTIRSFCSPTLFRDLAIETSQMYEPSFHSELKSILQMKS